MKSPANREVLIPPTKPVTAFALIGTRKTALNTQGFWLDPCGKIYPLQKIERSEWASRHLQSHVHSRDNTVKLMTEGWRRGVVGYTFKAVSVEGVIALSAAQRASLEVLGMEVGLPVTDANTKEVILPALNPVGNAKKCPASHRKTDVDVSAYIDIVPNQDGEPTLMY